MNSCPCEPEYLDEGVFYQKYDSCSLYAYILGANKFLSNRIEDMGTVFNSFYENYKDKFDSILISKNYSSEQVEDFAWRKWEFAYQFPEQYVDFKFSSGTKFIEGMYSNFSFGIFPECREKFKIDPIKNSKSNKIVMIIHNLKNGSLLELNIKKSREKDTHFMIFGYDADENKFWSIETTFPHYFYDHTKYPRFNEIEFTKLIKGTLFNCYEGGGGLLLTAKKQ